jgi:hypothetical protein
LQPLSITTQETFFGYRWARQMKSAPTVCPFEVIGVWKFMSRLRSRRSLIPYLLLTCSYLNSMLLYIPCEIVNEELDPHTHLLSLPIASSPTLFSPRSWTHRRCALQKLFLRSFHLGIHGFHTGIRRHIGLATSSDLTGISLIMRLLSVTAETTLI